MDTTKIGMLIYVVRGQRVMVDWDLATLYGVENRSLNQAVKRHPERFPDDFMFKLTPSEAALLRSQIVIAKIDFSKQMYLPNAFTEQGVGICDELEEFAAVKADLGEYAKAEIARMGGVVPCGSSS